MKEKSEEAHIPVEVRGDAVGSSRSLRHDPRVAQVRLYDPKALTIRISTITLLSLQGNDLRQIGGHLEPVSYRSLQKPMCSIPKGAWQILADVSR